LTRVNHDDNSWLFRRSIVVDGNFSAEHMKMLRADKDVRLVNGEGYMVEENQYQKHLKETIEQKEVSMFFFFVMLYN
jgi:pentose-5-phosphate-3-epimerase